MKYKIAWAMVISILVFSVFLGGMSRLKDNGTFRLVDVEGEREYLNLFPIEGVAGDGTHGLTFRLEEGQLSTKFYALNLEQIRNLLFAEREGLKGIKRYNFNYYNAIYLNEISCYADSAPSKDANIQSMDKVYEEAIDKGYFDYEEFTQGETVVADKIDVYLDIWGGEKGAEARIRTGMTLQDKEYYYTRGFGKNKQISGGYSSFSELELKAFCVDIGGAYYSIVASSPECQGETSLYRIKKSELIIPGNPSGEEKLYRQNEFGEAEILRSFSVDKENRVLGMLAVGDEALGIFRIQEGALYFDVYDLKGNLLGQDLLSTQSPNKIDQTEAEVIAWDDGSVSIYYEMYDVVEEDENAQVWECVLNGLYQVDGKELKRLACYGESRGKLLSVCKNNLVLDVYMEFDEQSKIPYSYGYEVYLCVTNGDTGKVLYLGKIETDFSQDSLKNISVFNIARKAPYLEEAMKTQYIDGIIGERQRQISDVLPVNGKGKTIWWR